MKKILLLIAGLTIVSCSSDDNNPVAVNDTYIDMTPNIKSIALKAECNGPRIAFYCVTNETYNEVEDFAIAGSADGDLCDIVNFEDIDGVPRTGYIDAFNTNNGLGCTRQTNP